LTLHAQRNGEHGSSARALVQLSAKD